MRTISYKFYRPEPFRIPALDLYGYYISYSRYVHYNFGQSSTQNRAIIPITTVLSWFREDFAFSGFEISQKINAFAVLNGLKPAAKSSLKIFVLLVAGPFSEHLGSSSNPFRTVFESFLERFRNILGNFRIVFRQNGLWSVYTLSCFQKWKRK